MNKILLVLFFVLNLALVSCHDDNKGVDSIKIVNNSEDDIVIIYGRESHYKHMVIGGPKEGSTNREYLEFLRDGCIPAHSFKYLDHLKTIVCRSFESDTLFMAVFNMLDYDTLSREEFKSKYPIKYDYQITLQNMIDCDWTLFYPPYE